MYKNGLLGFGDETEVGCVRKERSKDNFVKFCEVQVKQNLGLHNWIKLRCHLLK